MKTNYEYKAHVYNVYDGDTMKAQVDLGFQTTTNQTFRLFGVDTPEMRGEERPDGIISRDFVRDLILDKEVTIKTHKDKKGKYGRYLAEVLYTDEDGVVCDLASVLLARGLAEPLNY